MENLNKLQELDIVKVNDDKTIELTEKGIFLVYTSGIFLASKIFIKLYAMIEKWGFNKEQKLEKRIGEEK